MATKALPKVIAHDEFVAQALRDPDFRREWERTALAHEVALRVVSYRAEHDLTQAQLARRLGMPQPQVARLETSEHTPSFATLARLAGRLGMEFTVNVAPAGREPRHIGKRACEASTRVERDGAVLRYLVA